MKKKDSNKSEITKKRKRYRSSRNSSNKKKRIMKENNYVKKLSKKDRRKKKKRKRTLLLKELMISFLVIFVSFIILKSLFFGFPKITGYGMTPLINDGERAFLLKKSTIKRFDIIYFKSPNNNQHMVRRVIGLPGEKVEYRNDELWINNKIVVERFIKAEKSDAALNNRTYTEDFTLLDFSTETTVPNNAYFVMGDNREYAIDSREFGFVDAKESKGVIKAILFPFHQATSF